jgi:predicted  nucleic acid-binding Zn-ribbon protein
MLTTKSLFTAEGLDDRSLEFLTSAIEKNNLPGFDYFEFKRAVVTLVGMNIDEATAFKSAFATAATLGLTKEKLVETAAYYNNVITKEKDQFDAALQNQTKVKVSAREEEIKRLRDQIERHKSDITRLQDEIAGYLNQIEVAESSAKTEGEKLVKAQSAFEATHKALGLQIEKDIESIHQYIG